MAPLLCGLLIRRDLDAEQVAFDPGGAAVDAVELGAHCRVLAPHFHSDVAELASNGGVLAPYFHSDVSVLFPHCGEFVAYLGSHAGELKLHQCRKRCNCQDQGANGSDSLAPLSHQLVRCTRGRVERSAIVARGRPDSTCESGQSAVFRRT